MSHSSRTDAQDKSSPRVVAVVQARTGSVRFPSKVLADLHGVPALRFLLTRLSRATRVHHIVVAIPDSSDNDALATTIEGWGTDVARGPEHDVLRRYRLAAAANGADIVVRVTGDCPFIDPLVVDTVVQKLTSEDADDAHTSTAFPDGFDVEAVTMDQLVRADTDATDAYDREHVTPWIRRHSDRIETIDYPKNLSAGRVTLDEPADLVVLRTVAEHFGHDVFSVDDVAALMEERPAMFEANQHLVRDEGATMTTGEKLWRRAKQVIPGGNMLLSKRAEQFLPNGWPAYFSRASGCEVWDLDGHRYVDMSLMGVGTNILGYGYPKVDEAVRRVIDAGNLSTLNCPEEVELAERLCQLHPWADMAKFTRSGGEACAVAVRIARAASGKPAVAICGYHGWHDWYLAANLADDSALDGHLLPGLTPNGVPRNLQGLTRPFLYNDLDALEEILRADDVGVVIMEVERSSPPNPGFLEGVRELTRRRGVVLIFDECTSGFRKVLGGLHLHYGIDPDIAIFGKTLGNGYAINAVIGRRNVMDAAQSTFISSTFWTERIGPTAAIAALDSMEAEDAPARIDQIGNQVRGIWQEVASERGLPLSATGLPALSSFSIPGRNPDQTKNLLTRQLLSEGFLGGMSVYASIAHTETVLRSYANALSEAVTGVAELQQSDTQAASESTVGFGRLA